jgi:hypothetical protein
VERFSKADEKYLGEKERIDLRYNVRADRPYGLVIVCRQSLLPTYLLYQTYAFMGNDAGHWMAEIERKKLRSSSNDAEKLIGGIEASIRQNDGCWKSIGMVNEHGPLATDTHLLPITGAHDSIVDIRLEFTKGSWRIDYTAMAEISVPVTPIRIHPSTVLKEGKEDSRAMAALLDSSRVLITMPGDWYTLKYRLPENGTGYELFLESRGYYLEWIRKEWIAEENPFRLAEMLLAPGNALKRLAPEFKRVEPQMEDCFWRSRYAKP